MVSEQGTRRHEAAHAAAAVWFGGRRVDCVRVDEPQDRVAGSVNTTLQRELGAVDLVISLVGWMADLDERTNWPPRWPVAEDEADAVGKLVRGLGLNQKAYEALVDLAEELLATPEFQRLVELISRALAVAPVLDAESVQILRRAAGVADPEPEGATPCST